MPLKCPVSVQKKQKKYYSGKKKCHTAKVQLIMHYETGQILSTSFAKGRIHDFKLFQKSLKYWPFKPLTIITDKGYAGLSKFGLPSLIPFKKGKKQPLHPYLKKLNIEINKRRMGVEHIFGALKRFKILSYPYRNRRSRLGLRFNLIAAIFNLELSEK
ncbi:MAG: hypothetical protein EOP48_31280 [Sphingobacteriales bacterium]|nr:MAG: hypothetical protein EOP48_31280 [Sphingobacteriales bacterium]